MGRNFLITGGAGFVGSSLAQKLLFRGERIIVVDNFNEYLHSASVKERNIRELYDSLEENSLPKTNLVVIRGDIRDIVLVAEALSKYEVDTIIHLAALVAVAPSIEDSLTYFNYNLIGTIPVLEAAKKAGIKKIIYASSVAVYGDNENDHFLETDETSKPLTPYAATKKAAEVVAHAYHHLNQASIVCLRFHTAYGPKQRPDMALFKFTEAIYAGKEITLFGDGSSTRDYTYIDDLIGGIINTIDWVKDQENVYEIINLGEARMVTLLESVRCLEKVIGIKAKLVHVPLRPGELQRTCADIDKAKKLIGYDPKFSFEEGIEEFIKWYNKIVR